MLLLGRFLSWWNTAFAGLLFADNIFFGGAYGGGQSGAGHLALGGVIHLLIERAKGR